jgi:hypothetical protein
MPAAQGMMLFKLAVTLSEVHELVVLVGDGATASALQLKRKVTAAPLTSSATMLAR